MNQKTLVTKEGLERIKTELQQLKDSRRGIAERIKDAKEQGDLSENAEYSSAKEEQSFAESRIAELEAILKTVEVAEDVKGGVIGVGSHVQFRIDAVEMSYDIVGANEANPAEGKISNDSPVGRALLGHRKGDIVEAKLPTGLQSIEIISVK